MSEDTYSLSKAFQSLLDTTMPADALLEQLALAFQRQLQADSHACGNCSMDMLGNFWLWLTDCGQDTAAPTSAERMKRIRTKLRSIILRFDSDEALMHYLKCAATNFTNRDKGLFAQFYRAFYKKAREALMKDSRFLHHHDGNILLWELTEWQGHVREVCIELSSELANIAHSLRQNAAFPPIKPPKGDHFIASTELADASHRTLAYDSFHFICTLAVIFNLLKDTGQFGSLLPRQVEAETQDGDGNAFNQLEQLPWRTPTVTEAMLAEGNRLASKFWRMLSPKDKCLLAFYIIPKKCDAKISRAQLRDELGFSNDVTMKNHEDAVVEELKRFFTAYDIEDSAESVCFMQGLERIIDDFVKFAEIGHLHTMTPSSAKLTTSRIQETDKR